MKRNIPLGIALLFSGNVSWAAPTVTGNTISWPDDGWYQVQNEQTFRQVCGGTRSCTVENGSYVVINHTTGERFAGIKVNSNPVSAEAITVNGNTISWPNDGWYQVQNEQNYQQICAGTRACTVENGSYVVINHTTGERYDGIVVSGHSTDVDAITVNGSVITWPDDGWYQVQDEENFREVCSGTRSCTVDNGSYVVINHTTGERFSGIQVGNNDMDNETSTENPAQLPVGVTVTGNVISWPDDGWYQVQDEENFAHICGGTLSCTVEPGSYVVINHTTGERHSGIVVTGSGNNGAGNTDNSPEGELERELSHIFKLINTPDLSMLPSIEQLSSMAETGVQSVNYDSQLGSFVISYDCPQGGTITNWIGTNETGGVAGFSSVNACAYQGYTLTADVEFTTTSDIAQVAGQNTLSATLSDLLVSYNNESQFQANTGSISFGLVNGITVSQYRLFNDVEYSDSSLSITAATIELSLINPVLPLDMSDVSEGLVVDVDDASMSTIDGAVSIKTEETVMLDYADGTSISGVIRASVADNDWLLEFDAGDPQTFSVTVENFSSTTSFLLAADRAFGFLTP